MKNSCSRALLFAFAWFIFDASDAEARIEPSFHLEQATWDATHIVVLEPDRKREGTFRVVESWKGDLPPQSEAPEINVSLPVGQRVIYDTPVGPARDQEPKLVTEHRRVLFLIKQKTSAGKVSWASAASARAGDRDYDNPRIATIWLEGGKAYAIQQLKNPGPARMHPLQVFLDKEPFQEDMDEARVKKEVDRIVALQEELRTALSIEDAAERAKALRPLLQAKSSNVWREGFPALCKCGRAAVLPLCELLKDESLFSRHAEIAAALARFGGRDASVAMVRIVKDELAFWRKHAVDLPEGWRAGKGTLPDIANNARKHQARLSDALEFLSKYPTPTATKPVEELRDYWLSLPQLDGNPARQNAQPCQTPDVRRASFLNHVGQIGKLFCVGFLRPFRGDDLVFKLIRRN